MGNKKLGRVNQVRLTDRELTLIQNIRANPDSEEFLRTCKEKGINPSDVSQYWDKDKRYSIQVKGQEKDWDGLVAAAVSRLEKYSPKFRKIKRTPVDDPHCLVVDPADIHVGKLASFVETGGKYDIDTALARVDEGVDGIIKKSSGYNIDKVILVIGNDVLHVDSTANTTTKGTRQDTSGMWHEMVKSAEHMYVRVIEKLLPIADVEVVFNPSNHDYHTGYLLAQTIQAYFRHSKNITFDVDISHRKYTKYGSSLIGTSHGDGAKMSDMPMLMATENPIMWSECKHRYVYLHHKHHKIALDLIGVTIEYLRSPSEPDAWHAQAGYTGNKVAIEGFLHSHDNGQVARLTHLF